MGKTRTASVFILNDYTDLRLITKYKVGKIVLPS